jgi:hypothetical protein
MALQSMTALASITLQSASSSVTFSGIPQNYRDLILVVAGSATASASLTFIRLNGDTGSNYSNVFARGNGSNAASSSETTTGAWFFYGNQVLGVDQSNAISQIMDYSATDKHKSILTRANINNALGPSVEMTASRWASTVAVTSLQVYVSSNNFAAGSTFNLYGRIG